MTVSHPLQDPLDCLARELRTQLPLAVAGEVEPLHQARVATRRLREILPLCEVEVSRGPARRARRRLRRVGRVLGRVREVDVSRVTVDRLLADGVIDARCAARLEEHLQNEREVRREQMHQKLGAVNVRRLERDLAEVARDLGMRLQTDAWGQRLAARIEKRAARLKDAMVFAGALYIPDRVHAVRIAAKQLRYSLELARATGEARTKDTVREVKGAQESLGQLHDFQVLGAAVQDLASPRPPSEAADTEIDSVRLWIERECRRLHSEYVGFRDQLLNICEGSLIHAERIWTERGGEPAAVRRVSSVGRALKMNLRRSPRGVRARGDTSH